jgi:hypothetical protein
MARFSAHISRFLDDKLTVIVLTNCACADAATLTGAIAGLYVPGLAAAERTAVPIDPKILDAYTGVYELRPDIVLTITREGDRLWLQATAQSRAEIFAASETVFFTKVADLELVFVKDASGAVTRVILHQGGADTEAKKIR